MNKQNKTYLKGQRGVRKYYDYDKLDELGYKLIDNINDIDFKRNKQKIDRLQFVFTTITVYNSVDNEYIRNTTEKLNEKIKKEKLYEDERRRQEEINTKKNDLLSNMTDEEYDDLFKK